MNQVMWSPGMSLEALEKMVIQNAFSFYRGNKTSTAQSLGIAIRTLENKLDKYQMEEKEQTERLEHARREREAFKLRERGIPVGAQWDTGAVPSRFDPRGQELPAIGLGNLPGPTEIHGTQSASKPTTQQPVSLPERQEIQGVLSRAASQPGARKTR